MPLVQEIQKAIFLGIKGLENIPLVEKSQLTREARNECTSVETALRFIAAYAITIGMKVELGESLATAINAEVENVVKVPKAEAEVFASGEVIAPVVDEIYQKTNNVVKVPKAEAEVVASGREIATVVDEIYQFASLTE